jgi:hypothetical protein
MVMLNEILEIIKVNYEVITSISGVVFGCGTLIIASWIAYFSPQALQSKIEKKKYLKEKRNEHYMRLNQEIFKPLSNNLFLHQSRTGKDELDLLKIEFVSLDETLLKKGNHHLNIDIPNYIAHNETLHNNVEKYNSALQTFYDGLDSEIRNEFKGILELNENYIFEQDFFILGVRPVKKVILILFSQCLNEVREYNQKLIQDVCKSAIIADSDKRASCALGGKEPCQIFGISIANIPFVLMKSANFWETKENNDKKIQQIIDHICSIISNESIFKEIKYILDTREQLLETEKNISHKIKQISESINKGDYETIAKCCTDKKIL